IACNLQEKRGEGLPVQIRWSSTLVEGSCRVTSIGSVHSNTTEWLTRPLRPTRVICLLSTAYGNCQLVALVPFTITKQSLIYKYIVINGRFLVNITRFPQTAGASKRRARALGE